VSVSVFELVFEGGSLLRVGLACRDPLAATREPLAQHELEPGHGLAHASRF